MKISVRMFDSETGGTYTIEETIADPDEALEKFRKTITAYQAKGLTLVKEPDARQWRNGHGINGDRPDGTKLDHWATFAPTTQITSLYIQEKTGWGPVDVTQHTGLEMLGWETGPAEYAEEVIARWEKWQTEERRKADIKAASDVPDFEFKYTCLACEAPMVTEGNYCPACTIKRRHAAETPPPPRPKTIHDEASDICNPEELLRVQDYHREAAQFGLSKTAIHSLIQVREAIYGKPIEEWDQETLKGEIAGLGGMNHADITRRAVAALEEAHGRHPEWDFAQNLPLKDFGDEWHLLRRVDGHVALHTKTDVGIQADVGTMTKEGWILRPQAEYCKAIQANVEATFDYLPDHHEGEDGDLFPLEIEDEAESAQA